MRGVHRSRADAAAAFREDLLAMIATLGGEFDSRIKELQKLKREMDERNEARMTLEQAQHTLDAAAKQAADIRMEASLQLDRVNKQMEQFKEQQAKVTALAREAKAAQEDIAVREKALTAARSEFDRVKADALADLSRRGDEVSKREAAADKLMNELDDKRRRLDERLKQLGTI